jgi:hypothetical protein
MYGLSPLIWNNALQVCLFFFFTTLEPRVE